MSKHDHPIWVLLDKLQMDNREQAAKLVELRSYVAGLDLPDPKTREFRPYDPPAHAFTTIHAMIRNGAIPNEGDLEVEIREANIPVGEARDLREAFAAKRKKVPA